MEPVVTPGPWWEATCLLFLKLCPDTCSLRSRPAEGAVARRRAPPPPVPCWPLCTGKSTAACRSCLRKLWARSSRCSRGRRGLREGHSRMNEAGGQALPGGSSRSFQPSTSVAGIAGDWGGRVGAQPPHFHPRTGDPTPSSPFDTRNWKTPPVRMVTPVFNTKIQGTTQCPFTGRPIGWVLGQAICQEELLRKKDHVT